MDNILNKSTSPDSKAYEDRFKACIICGAECGSFLCSSHYDEMSAYIKTFQNLDQVELNEYIYNLRSCIISQKDYLRGLTSQVLKVIALEFTLQNKYSTTNNFEEHFEIILPAIQNHINLNNRRIEINKRKLKENAKNDLTIK